MFMGQTQFAQNIGISNPGLSLASWGTDPRQRAFGQQGTMGGHAPVSYASGGMGGPGYGGGSKFAGSALSWGAGGASGLLSLAANPIGAFMGGMGMGGAGTTGFMHGAADLMGASGATRGLGMMAGGGLMGGAFAAGATFLPAYAAQKAIGAYAGGAQQQQMIQTQLGGFQFQNSQSRTGQGFSREDALQIGNQVRSIAHIPEMMTSVEELTRLIPKLKSAGVMSGVRDAAEFNARFRESVKTLREVSRVMGSTMEEASKFFEHSRSVGFLGRTDQLKNVMNVQFTAGQTGMSEQQVMQLQQGGAQMAVGRGIRRSVGATAVTNMAQMFGRGMQSGRIGQSDLEDMTGAQGEAAVGAAAQQMTEKLARFAESTGAGKASMMGLAEFDEKGRYVGINKELARKYAAGEVTKEDLMRRVANFTGQQKIAATRKVGSMAIEFAGATGPGGAMSFMANVLAEGGHTGESAKYMMQRYGFSEVEVDVMSQMQGMQGMGGEERQKKAFERKRQMEADIQDRTDPSKIMARIGTKMKSGLGLQRAEEEGAKMFSVIGKAYDEFVDDVVGRYSVGLSEKGAQRLLQSFQSQKGKDDMKALFALKAPQLTTVGGDRVQPQTWGQKLSSGMGLMSWMSTGSKEGAGDVTEQKAFMERSFGMQGKGADEINSRLRELKGLGAGDAEMQKEVQSFITELDRDQKYTQASPADRLKMLSEKMEDEGSKEQLGGTGGYEFGKGRMVGGSRTKAIEAFKARHGLAKMAEVAMAGTKSLVADVTNAEANIREMGMKHSINIRAADEHLVNTFASHDTATAVSSAIASDIQVGHNLRSALMDDKVAAVLGGTEDDDEKGARALELALKKPEGSISPSEYRESKAAYGKIADELEKGKVTKQDALMAIGSRTMAEFTKDIGVSQTAAKDIVEAGMSEGELKSALKAFSSSAGGEDAYVKMQKVQDVIQSQSAAFATARKELASAKKGSPAEKAAREKLEKLSAGMGKEITGRVSEAGSAFDRQVKDLGNLTESIDKAASDLGVSVDDLKGFATGDKKDQINIKEVAAKVRDKSIARMATGGAFVGTDAQKKETKDEHLDKTLSSIDSTLKLVNTNLAVNSMSPEGKKKYYEEHKDAAKALAEGKVPQ